MEDSPIFHTFNKQLNTIGVNKVENYRSIQVDYQKPNSVLESEQSHTVANFAESVN